MKEVEEEKEKGRTIQWNQVHLDKDYCSNSFTSKAELSVDIKGGCCGVETVRPKLQLISKWKSAEREKELGTSTKINGPVEHTHTNHSRNRPIDCITPTPPIDKHIRSMVIIICKLPAEKASAAAFAAKTKDQNPN